MKTTLTRNTTQPRSQTMREITDAYNPSKGMRLAVRFHNSLTPSLILAVFVIAAVLAFVTAVAPHVAANIIHDIITGK